MAKHSSRLAAFGLAIGCLSAPSAGAVQFTSTPDLRGSVDGGFTYVGPQNDRENLGASQDGGRDAFDVYGFFSQVGGPTLSRQTELFQARNLFRFFDTFTNTTASTFTGTLAFGGELGSDVDTRIVLNSGGLLVSCNNAFNRPSGCDGFRDPILAHVAGNNGLGIQSIIDRDDYVALFPVSVAPGESVSLLNFAFLASDANGTNAAGAITSGDSNALDNELAISTGQSLLSNPFLDGLTAQQRSQIINFAFGAAPAPVPEPASVALLGLGLLGASLVRRKRA